MSELSSDHGTSLAGRSATNVGGRLWFGDVRRVLMTNLLAYGGSVWLVTITAPGSDLLPWGEDGKVVLHAAHEWNRTAPKRWSQLHRRAQQEVRRALGDGDTVLAYAWQMQRRGVLHLHLVLGFDTGHERSVAWRYVQELRARAREHGFGFIDARDRDGRAGRSTVMEPHRAAGYVSRYLSDSSQMVEAINAKHRPARLIYVTRRLTRSTSCTMTRLRRARYLYMIRAGRSSIVAEAGRLPAWFRDQAELIRVQSLLAAPGAP